jgi:DNA-binding transcriptional ArsR family regulator
MISDAALEQMAVDGVEGWQIVNAILADREAGRRRRAERKAARLAALGHPSPGLRPTSPLRGEVMMNEADSESGSMAPKGDARVSVVEVAAGSAVPANGGRKGPARLALLMMPGLRPAARLVGAQLVEHCNLATGRCDPSVGRIAQRTGLSERSVSRAIGELVAGGLVSRLVHGSFGHRNAYRIAWERLGAAADVVQSAKMNEADSVLTLTPESVEPDRRVTQTPSRKPHPDSVGGGHSAREPFQITMPLPIDGGRVRDPVEAAIRGKYRDHEPRKTYLVAWWGLSDAERSGFRDLAAFEAWLREQGATGPPQRQTG